MQGHVIREADVPAEGENYLMLDPAARNFFMLWIRRAEGKAYVYREWPGSYHIPGVGVPDPWAVPSSRNPKTGNDGERGGAQASWGFSLLRYKFEIARLEGWRGFEEWKAQGVGPDEVPDYGLLEEWHEDQGAREVVETRFVDCRPATAPKVENDRVSTLHTDLNNLGMWWTLSPGGAINDDVVKIQSAFEMGTLFVAESCRNLRWALANWTGADGEKGACKDPVDCLRWYFGAGLGDGGSSGVRECGSSKVRRANEGMGFGAQRGRVVRASHAAGPPRVRWRGR